MRVITLWRPWGAAVVLGMKTIETRTHTRFWGLKGERIAIHNAQKWDPHAEEEMKRFLGLHPPGLFVRSWLLNTPQAIIGTVYVADKRFLEGLDDEKAALCRIFENDCGLVLTMPRPLLNPIPAKGQRGIWNYPIVETTPKARQPIKEAEDERVEQAD